MWKHLTVDDLKKILSDDEVEKINEISTADPNVVQNVIDIVADTWRGSFRAKSYVVDVRQHYTPEEYTYWILVHARYALWTRFPNSPAFALDEARTKEYEKAMSFLENPSIGTSKPDYSGDPEAEEEAKKEWKSDSAIGVQFQRFGSCAFFSGNEVKSIW